MNIGKGYPPRKVLATPEEIRDLRVAAGMSKTAVSRWLGVHFDTVRAWEAGRSVAPKMAIMLLKIAAAKRQALITGQKASIDT